MKKGPPYPICWNKGHLWLLDQRLLPHIVKYRQIRTIKECHEAIKSMVVRGAPCIGFTGLFGLVLWVHSRRSILLDDFISAARFLKEARPTAVNLATEIDSGILLARNLEQSGRLRELPRKILAFAQMRMDSAEADNLSMAKAMADELKKKYGTRPLRLLTHCNTGVLACGKLGTALGAISFLHGKKRVERVWVDETRPYLQGSRLTSFELLHEGIRHDIVVEGVASHLMRSGMIDAVLVGADRIARNGDTANKIGTATLAVVAFHYGVPFYVLAPTSSFDLSIASGEDIPIEIRDENEILCYGGVNAKRIAPKGAHAFNPSFDITTHDLITGIFCEKGSITPVNEKKLLRVTGGEKK
jgi:methylthioribose-1-phosphate isomerase